MPRLGVRPHVVLLNYSLCVLFSNNNIFISPLKNDASANWIPDRKKGGCCGLDMLKNKLQIPETHDTLSQAFRSYIHQLW